MHRILSGRGNAEMETRGLPVSTPIDSRGPRLQLGSDPAPFVQDVRPIRATPALAPRIHANPARDSTTNAGIPTHPALDVASYGCSPVKPRPRPRPRRDLQIDNSTPRLLYQLIRWMVGSRLSGPSFLCARSLCHGSHTQNH